MAENKNQLWSRIINIVITVLTAIATTFGLNQF
ncbi:MAG: smalltalk protein [Bacteroidaceae bacterium]|nr:smalltalk protein [Bacteroidaceae bacterium]MBR6989723.1 smalltalk protein [Bacteroidaceae bacterium]MBR6989781.1 smalltalk protein [Bacteroidaceae bacterium]